MAVAPGCDPKLFVQALVVSLAQEVPPSRHSGFITYPAQQFWEALGPQRMQGRHEAKRLQPLHIQVDRQQHPFLSVQWRPPTPLLKRCATGVQLCASAMLHTLHVTMVVGGVGKRPMLQRG